MTEKKTIHWMITDSIALFYGPKNGSYILLEYRRAL